MPGQSGDLPPPLRVGRSYTEAELAAAADVALVKEFGETGRQTKAADALGFKSTSPISMALALVADPDNLDGPPVLQHPKRGHSVRRLILHRYAGRVFDGPYWRAALPGGPETDTGAD